MAEQAAPPKRRMGWEWLLWWQTPPDELKRQVEYYDTLTFLQSMRGISVALLSFAIATTLLFLAAGAGGVDVYSLFDVALMAICATFIWLGHRWAMIAAMVLWTLEKVSMLADGLSGGNPASIITQPLWWAVYLHAFYFAFRVEQERRKMPAAPDVSVFN
jgi:hypothetical protein